MIIREIFPELLRAPDGADGAGAGGQDGGGGTGGTGDTGGTGGTGGGATPPWKAPDYLPDHFRGKDADETIRKTFDAYEPLRRSMAERGTVPKDPTAYDFKFSDKAAPVLNIRDDDKVLPVLRQVMHKHAITDKQTLFVSDLVDGLIDAGLVPKAQDPNDMWKALAPSDFKGSDLERVQAGQKAQREAQALIDGTKGQPGWDADMAAELQMLTASPAGLRVLKSFQAAGVIKSVQPGGQGGQGGVSKADIDTRRRDPRNIYGDAKYDPAFAAETEAMYKRLHGNT